jgi:hypothetical protein
MRSPVTAANWESFVLFAGFFIFHELLESSNFEHPFASQAVIARSVNPGKTGHVLSPRCTQLEQFITQKSRTLSYYKLEALRSTKTQHSPCRSSASLG